MVARHNGIAVRMGVRDDQPDVDETFILSRYKSWSALSTAACAGALNFSRRQLAVSFLKRAG
jgi:hypothetical protein